MGRRTVAGSRSSLHFTDRFEQLERRLELQLTHHPLTVRTRTQFTLGSSVLWWPWHSLHRVCYAAHPAFSSIGRTGPKTQYSLRNTTDDGTRRYTDRPALSFTVVVILAAAVVVVAEAGAAAAAVVV